jgi:ABC-type multidrug transport system ATPase subunit
VVKGDERKLQEFILLDEPFAGIDPIAVEDIQAIVAKLKNKNIGILITDHNVTETLSICDRAYLLIEGKIFKHGTAEELAEDDQVKRLYLGRNFELRRKDWLLDENRNTERPEISSIIHSVESAVSWFDQIKIKEKEIEHSIGYRYSGAMDDEDHLKRDYVQYIEELKLSLRAYVDRNSDKELDSKLKQLESATTFTEVQHDMNAILFLLKAKA